MNLPSNRGNTLTDTDLTLIAALLDRSGSLAGIVDDMCGVFDTFIAGEPAQQGTTICTPAQFDNEYQPAYHNKPIDSVTVSPVHPRR